MKSHNEFLKDVERESTIPAQIEKTLSPESKEDKNAIREVRNKFGKRTLDKIRKTESFSAGDALSEKSE